MNRKSLFDYPIKIIHHVLALLMVAAYSLPYFYFGTKSALDIADNMDSIVVWMKILNQHQHNFFDTTTIDQALTRLPLSSFRPNLDMSFILFSVFGIWGGYVACKIFIALMAYWGMYKLLIGQTMKMPKLLAMLVAVLFAIQPFWGLNASVALVPLVFSAFECIHLEARPKLLNWMIIIVSPFCCGLFLSGFFYLIVIFSFLSWQFVRHRKWNKMTWLALAVHAAMYCISHWPIFNTFFNGFVSHRSIEIASSNSFKQVVQTFFYSFFYGTAFTKSVHKFMLVPIFVGFLFAKRQQNYFRWYGVLFGFVLLSTLWSACYRWQVYTPFVTALRKVVPISIDRFYWLQPTCWYLLLAISVKVISDNFKRASVFLLPMLLLQYLYMYKQHEAISNNGGTSFSAFYAEGLYKKIANRIGQPQKNYRVVSLGIYPNIALYNGFYTADGFVTNYPLSYRTEFEKVMAATPILNDMKDGSLNQCYLYTQATKDIMHIGKQTQLPAIRNLEWNFEALKKLGVQYIFSALPLDFDGNHPLEFIDLFEDEKSFWRIYLYKIN